MTEEQRLKQLIKAGFPCVCQAPIVKSAQVHELSEDMEEDKYAITVYELDPVSISASILFSNMPEDASRTYAPSCVCASCGADWSRYLRILF